MSDESDSTDAPIPMRRKLHRASDKEAARLTAEAAKMQGAQAVQSKEMNDPLSAEEHAQLTRYWSGQK